MAETPVGYQALENSERPAASGASRIQSANPNDKISVSIRLRSRPGGELPDFNKLAATPSRERKYLSREEFAERHGAAQADIDKLVAFAKSEGLTVVETSIGRRTVVLSGTADQMNKAFGVELGYYQTPTEVYTGFEGKVHVPADLAPAVEGVYGLDTRQIGKPLFRGAASVATAPLATTPLTPAEVAKLYQFPTNSAAGQTIGILEFGGGYKPSDITTYFKNQGLTAPTVTFVGIDGATNNFTGAGADVEVALDIQVAGSVALGAKIVVYFAPNTEQGWVDCITTAVHDTVNKPSVLSISWGGSESQLNSDGFIKVASPALQAAAPVGVTIFCSSGDSGSNNPADVTYPASDPAVSGCGGTTIENVSGSSFTQVAWAGSGGGISNAFGLPDWQGGANIPPSVNPKGHIGRGVPDIAGNADPNSGYMLILNGNQTGPWGGTSAVAPLYAGLVAVLNAALGEPIGFYNYNLYALEGPYVYSDVTSGSNGLYNAGPGWDAVTGLGSVIGAGMATGIEGVGLPPALAVFNNAMYMGWKGIERDERIFYTTYNGASWAAQQLVANVATSSGVALAVFNGKLYMAWKGQQLPPGETGVSQSIWFNSFNGSSWAAEQMIPGIGTSTGPRLAVYNGKLYMAWKGIEGDQRLFWSSYNGSTWTAQQVIPGVASSVGPALAVYNGLLYAMWKGEFGDQTLWYSSFNGTSWAPQKSIAGWSSEGPSLAVYAGKLYAAWKGELADQRLWYSSFNGSVWAPQQMIPGVWSSIGPNIQAFGNNLLAVWKGMLGDERIWYTTFNGTTWAAQQIVPGVGTSSDLVAGAGD